MTYSSAVPVTSLLGLSQKLQKRFLNSVQVTLCLLEILSASMTLHYLGISFLIAFLAFLIHLKQFNRHKVLCSDFISIKSIYLAFRIQSNVDTSSSIHLLRCDFTFKSLRNSIPLFLEYYKLFKTFFLSTRIKERYKTQFLTTLMRLYSISLPSLRSLTKNIPGKQFVASLYT